MDLPELPKPKFSQGIFDPNVAMTAQKMYTNLKQPQQQMQPTPGLGTPSFSDKGPSHGRN